MKTCILFSAFFLSLAVLISCGTSDPANSNHSEDSKESSKNSDEKLDVPVTRNCCFKTVEEGFSFFPVLSGNITTSGSGKPAGSVADCNEENRRSQFNQRFLVNGTEYLFKLEDKCTDPADLAGEYERSHENMKIAEVFKDLDKAGVYRAFGTEDKKRKLTYVFAIVDGRFKIDITGFEKTNLEEALLLFAQVPVDKLAAYGK